MIGVAPSTVSRSMPPELLVRPDDLSVVEIRAGESPGAELQDGEVQLRIERFGLTANNVTYGALGDQLGYWKVFPAADGWGRVPAWGYARVVQSRAADVPVGRRVFGLVPMTGFVTMRPQARRSGFADAADHRAELSPVYNQYLDVGDDADDLGLILRPLFGTSVLLDLLLAEDAFGDAGTVVLTSASSRTAYGLAHLLGRRPVDVIGLTSARHREWVEALGLYDRVLTYEDVGELTAPGGAVLVDFAGDADLLGALRETLGPNLRRAILVGFTHQEIEPADAPPGMTLFFAPDEMVRRGRTLGPAYAEAWSGFAPVAGRIMRIEQIADAEALVEVYRSLLEGRADPAVGHVVTL